MPRQGRGRYAASPRFRKANQTFPTGKNYASLSTTKRRHQFIADNNSVALLPNEWVGIDLAKFVRTFDPGVTDDVEPTPTASNNFQSTSVMNGSHIQEMNGLVNIKHTGSTEGVYVDAYVVALSFFEADNWDTTRTASCLVDFDTTGGAGDNSGAVTFRTMTGSQLYANNYASFRHLQHYMPKLKSIYLGAADSNKTEHQIIINDIPKKCRRSQTGMFYGLILHNDSVKNKSGNVSIDVSTDISFTETPSDNRMPFIN